jgi:4-hydroxybenzoate polyprenyltransferase
MRPYLLFVSGAAGLVGLAFAKHPTVLRLVLSFLVLFLSYGFGQALTDVFQTDTDSISSPYRPLVRGIISRKQVLVVSLCGLVAGVAFLGYLNPATLVFGFLGVVGLLSYTHFKRTWWGGPPCDALIVALLAVIGRLTERQCSPKDLLALDRSESLAFFLAVLAVFFGYANFVVMGYFKDISADRKTGYQTFPVVFGWAPACVYSDFTALAAAAFSAGAIFSAGGATVWGIALLAVAVATNLWAQVVIHRVRDETKSHRPIANVVRAFVLYCLAIAANVRHGWIPFVVLFYVLFELALNRRPERTQV